MMKNPNQFSWTFLSLPTIWMVLVFVSLFRLDTALIPVNSPLTEEFVPDVWKLQMEAYLPRALQSSGIPGISIAIISSDSVLTTASFGKEKSFNGKDITNSTVFEAASLTKPLTAWAILDLEAKGKINLDLPIQEHNMTYSIRQLLNHSAGFDNNLGAPLAPVKAAGSFSYAGQGYLKLASTIEEVTEKSYTDYMNNVVLKELGMRDSYIGNRDDRTEEASPHISATMVMASGAIVFLLLSILLTLMARVVFFFLKKRIFYSTQKVIAYSAAGCCVIFFTVAFGTDNGLRFMLINVIIGTLIIFVIRGLREWNACQFRHAETTASYGWTTAGLMSIIALVYALVFYTPVPLKKRASSFPSAAGLHTTATDYIKFIQVLMDTTGTHGQISKKMLDSRVAVNAHNEWGLGIGVQTGEHVALWHWGVNYPGFQSFFVAWPERKSAMVIMMNGGSMLLTNGSPKFLGLELARNLVAKTFGGEHHGYWQGIQ